PGTPAAADPAKPAARPPLPPAVVPEDPEPGAVYLSDLPEAGVVKGTWPLGKEGDTGEPLVGPIRVAGRFSPRGLGLHPPPAPGYAAVSYKLGKAAVRLKAGVALNDTAFALLTGPVFEVWGDGKRLWQSPPVEERGKPVPCRVDLTGVDVLELRVTTGRHFGVHAVWLDPRLIPADR
ncbi:MAG: NPCBM/NEW2 domain-containing protein, partial [Gemmataceae bacterium]|nr:NPCBM/NEW2 domain-containing protein [Gemmataceae bacterium]